MTVTVEKEMGCVDQSREDHVVMREEVPHQVLPTIFSMSFPRSRPHQHDPVRLDNTMKSR